MDKFEILPFATLAEVKEFLEVRDNITKNDASLQHLSILAAHDIHVATGRVFTAGSLTEYFGTINSRREGYNFSDSASYSQITDTLRGGTSVSYVPQTIRLRGVKVDPESVQVWHNPTTFGGANFLVEDSQLLELGKDYAFEGEGNDRIVLAISSQDRPRAIRVDYDYGYAKTTATPPTLSGDAPDWLKTVFMIQLQFLRSKTRLDNIAMAAERTVSEKGKVSVSSFLHTSGLTPEVIPHLAKLRRLNLGKR